jgi:hypothetical protein
MKKNILKAFLVLTSLAFASSAFAVTTVSSSTVIGGGTYAPSAKVTIKVISTAGAYAATSQHLTGKKEFGTNNQDPKIYFKDSVASGPDAPGSAAESFSGWSTY